MANDSVLLTQTGRIWTATLNRSTKANALTSDMMAKLANAAGNTAPDDVLVLRSASANVFCAGADIAEFVAGDEALATQEHALLEMIQAFACSPAPVVALARGKASGAGAILLALADVVIAADDLTVVCPEIRFGMFPVIVEAVLQSRMPAALATQLCLTGRPLSAHEAVQLGFISETIPVCEFDTAADERLDAHLQMACALRIARQSRLHTYPPATLMRQVQSVAPLMRENFARPGVREQINAYLSSLRKNA